MDEHHPHPHTPHFPHPHGEHAPLKASSAIATVLIFFLIILIGELGILSTWIHGLSFQLGDRDYRVTAQEVPGSYSLDLNLRDPDSNIGKVIYEDDTGCRVTVADLTWNADGDSAWKIWFMAEGFSTARGGAIVSGMMDMEEDPNIPYYSTDDVAQLTVATSGGVYEAIPAGNSILSRNDKGFGYTLFYGPGVPSSLPESTSVTLEGLMRFTTERRA